MVPLCPSSGISMIRFGLCNANIWLQACVLAVPKVHILYKGKNQDEHLRSMGYKEVEQERDAKTGKGTCATPFTLL